MPCEELKFHSMNATIKLVTEGCIVREVLLIRMRTVADCLPPVIIYKSEHSHDSLLLGWQLSNWMTEYMDARTKQWNTMHLFKKIWVLVELSTFI